MTAVHHSVHNLSDHDPILLTAIIIIRPYYTVSGNKLGSDREALCAMAGPSLDNRYRFVLGIKFRSVNLPIIALSCNNARPKHYVDAHRKSLERNTCDLIEDYYRVGTDSLPTAEAPSERIPEWIDRAVFRL